MKMPGRIRSLDVNFFCTPAVYLIPWVPETFHARFPVSVKSSRGFAARVFGLRPKTCWPAADIRRKLLLAREKKPLVPRVSTLRLYSQYSGKLLRRHENHTG